MYDANKKTINAFTFDNTSEIFNEQHAFKEHLYNQQEENEERARIDNQRAYDEAQQDYYSKLYEGEKENFDRLEYLSNVKNALVTECMYKLLMKSMSTPITENNKIAARNLCSRFVKENGANNLLREFRTKNLLLSEFSRICDKTYKSLLETDKECAKDDECYDGVIGAKISSSQTDEFYRDLEDVDMDDASKIIKDKVSDAIVSFMDDNISAKMDYQEIIDAAKDQIDSADTESQVESYNALAKEHIKEMENNREKSLYHIMVESMVKSIFKDDDLKSKYITKGTNIDMESVIESAQIMYTMLEMVNTVGIVNVNEEFISNYIKSI